MDVIHRTGHSAGSVNRVRRKGKRKLRISESQRNLVRSVNEKMMHGTKTQAHQKGNP